MAGSYDSTEFDKVLRDFNQLSQVQTAKQIISKINNIQQCTICAFFKISNVHPHYIY